MKPDVSDQKPDEPPKDPRNKRGLSPNSLANLRKGGGRPPKDVEGEESTGEHDQLSLMRHVLDRPAAQDITAAQKHCRVWLKKDPRGFWIAKTSLEGKQSSGAGAGAPGKPAPEAAEDIGEAKSLKLLEELLATKGWKK